MTQGLATETVYQDMFRTRLAEQQPVWLKILRESAFERFAALGFPTPRQEDWKYTNLAPLTRAFTAPQTGEGVTLTPEQFAPLAYDEAAQSRLVFVNGHYDAALSSVAALPAGVVALTWAEAWQSEYANVVKEHLARGADYQNHALTALNTALFDGGAVVYVPRDVKVDAPIHLAFVAHEPAAQSVIQPRILVVMERGSAATLIESYARTAESTYFTNAVVEIALADEAQLTHYKVQRESRHAFHIATTHAALQRSSRYDTTTIMLGAQLSRHDVAAVFYATGAECAVDGLYLVSGQQHTDTHSLIDHRLPHCVSHQNYKGILDEQARAVFNGKVFVHENANGTDAQQSNKNLLLSAQARVDTKPQLEIYNDDVKCAHGATVGQMEEEELFYLLSRGLHPDLARNLLTYGFAEEIINKIGLASIKAQLDEAVLNRLHAKLEV